jgi:hypothetical protein
MKMAIDIDIDIYRCVCFSPLGWRLFSVSFDIRELLKLLEINQVFQGVALVVKGLKRINMDKPLKTCACKNIYTNINIYVCVYLLIYLFILYIEVSLGWFCVFPETNGWGNIFCAMHAKSWRHPEAIWGCWKSVECIGNDSQTFPEKWDILMDIVFSKSCIRWNFDICWYSTHVAMCFKNV